MSKGRPFGDHLSTQKNCSPRSRKKRGSKKGRDRGIDRRIARQYSMRRSNGIEVDWCNVFEETFMV